MSRKLSSALLLFLFLAGVASVSAADLRVLSATPLAPGLEQLGEQYKRTTGQAIQVQTVTTPDINRILSSSEPFDILITTSAIVDQAIKDGKAAAKTLVGRVGIAVIVRSGANVPNINTPEALKQSVLAADGVIYNTAGSGQYVQKMLDDMGIGAQIQSKAARPTNAAQTMDRILQGKGNEIGFGLISEIKPYESKGVRNVGPLPAPVQNYTNYEAIVSAGSKLSDEAKRFIQYLTTPAAKGAFAATGVD